MRSDEVFLNQELFLFGIFCRFLKEDTLTPKGPSTYGRKLLNGGRAWNRHYIGVTGVP
ncbi:unnamed protein product [Coffea canephora]|uniref:Uncharacterized protein n=1 Tax=Coffea canephora TaxID=49390 RepID=A0A068U731_COFCA|nr:unnamed protein product [Coffea canephora]